MRTDQTMRHGDVADLMRLLKKQHETKYDVVVPHTHLAYQAGHMVVKEGRAQVEDAGVTLTTARLDPIGHFEDQVAGALGIPLRYMRTMREREAWSLLDHNVNHWLAFAERNYFIRGFLGLGEETGYGRAFLSDRYAVVDHLDAVTAMLDGVAEAGLTGDDVIISGDLSESKLRVKVEAPAIVTEARRFLRRYRGPNDGRVTDDQDKRIMAGLVMTNSETGEGAFAITPHITILVCANGMTRTVDGMRRVHLGGQMEQGRIQWSIATRRANLELIKGQTADAVRSYLSQEYLEEVAEELDRMGSKVLDRPQEVLTTIGKDLGYTEAERDSILNHFMDAGDRSSGGLVNAFTSYAGGLGADAVDRAIEIEADAFTILERAAKGAT